MDFGDSLLLDEAWLVPRGLTYNNLPPLTSLHLRSTNCLNHSRAAQHLYVILLGAFTAAAKHVSTLSVMPSIMKAAAADGHCCTVGEMAMMSTGACKVLMHIYICHATLPGAGRCAGLVAVQRGQDGHLICQWTLPTDLHKLQHHR